MRRKRVEDYMKQDDIESPIIKNKFIPKRSKNIIARILNEDLKSSNNSTFR